MERCLGEECLKKLPAGKFVRFEGGVGHKGEKRLAVAWRWVCFHASFGEYPSWSENRVSHFDVVTGEYLGDVIED